MKRAILESIGILLMVGVLAAITAAVHPNPPAWHKVEDPTAGSFELLVPEARDPKFAEAMWIDARATTDYEAGHYDGAISLNDANFEDQLWANSEKFTDLDRIIIIYCDGLECQRSTKIAQLLRERLQLRQVYILKGDWKVL